MNTRRTLVLAGGVATVTMGIAQMVTRYLGAPQAVNGALSVMPEHIRDRVGDVIGVAWIGNEISKRLGVSAATLCKLEQRYASVGAGHRRTRR